MDTAVKTVDITRAALIEKLIEYRSDDWDHHDTDDVLEFGRIGFIELSNEDLEQIALDYMLEEGGVEVAYTITDADTSKPSVEAINAEMLELCKLAYVAVNPGCELEARLKAAIAKAEGRTS